MRSEPRRTPNWSPLFGTAMASMFKRLCWCGMISGWPPAGSCVNWRSDWSKGRTRRLVDLFDPRHAKRVLMAFGRAYGALPENIGDLNSDQKVISGSIDFRACTGREDHLRAVGSLRRDGQREALDPSHAQKRWAAQKGVGLTFLEETFSASTAPPEHRFHQKAAQAVLKALLPESGTDIKGQMRSRQELLEASGYANRPRDFDDLIHILDPELRLITPTDPEGSASEDQQTTTERAILPTRTRLPRPLPAGLADPQAARDPTRKGGTSAGRTVGVVECQAREPPSAVCPWNGRTSGC